MKHKWVANGCSCHRTCMKCNKIVETKEKKNAPPCKELLSSADNMAASIEKLILNMPEVKKGYLFEEKK